MDVRPEYEDVKLISLSPVLPFQLPASVLVCTPVPRLLALHEVQLLLVGWSCPVGEDTFSVPSLLKSHIQGLVHNAIPSWYLQGIGSRMIISDSNALFTIISPNQDLYVSLLQFLGIQTWVSQITLLPSSATKKTLCFLLRMPLRSCSTVV